MSGYTNLCNLTLMRDVGLMITEANLVHLADESGGGETIFIFQIRLSHRSLSTSLYEMTTTGM